MLSVSYGLVLVLPISKESTVGALEATVLGEIRDVIPFNVFLILLQFVSKYLF